MKSNWLAGFVFGSPKRSTCLLEGVDSLAVGIQGEHEMHVAWFPRDSWLEALLNYKRNIR